MKITVVTPCRNAEATIRRTACSVLQQTAPVDIEYIVCDGASRDGTLDAIADLRAKIISEPDSSMYEALARGLSAASGDVIAYLNAGDYYHPQAFEVVQSVFASGKVNWITGMHVTYNASGVVTEAVSPFRYKPRLIECGFYGGLLPYVQQESTFWSSALNQKIDLHALAKLKLAGDAYLWMTFSKHSQLHIVDAYLGGFSKHSGQLSENINGYRSEQKMIARHPTPIEIGEALIEKALWHSPKRIRKLIDRHIRFDHDVGQWRLKTS